MAWQHASWHTWSKMTADATSIVTVNCAKVMLAEQLQISQNVRWADYCAWRIATSRNNPLHLCRRTWQWRASDATALLCSRLKHGKLLLERQCTGTGCCYRRTGMVSFQRAWAFLVCCLLD